MKKNGFLSSALLYGIMALFLVFMMITLAILGNRKLSVDKLKDKALRVAESEYVNSESLFVVFDGLQKTETSIANDIMWSDLTGNGNDGKLFNFTGNYQGNNYLTFSNNAYITGGNHYNSFGTAMTITTTIEPNTSVVRGLYTFGEYTTTELSGTSFKFCYSSNCVTVNGEFVNRKNQITVVLGDTPRIEIYINGILKLSSNINIMRLNTEFTIGKSNNKYYSGKMYNFIIYNHSLSEDEVYENYKIDKVKYGI